MGVCWSEPSVAPSHPVQTRSPMYTEKVVPTAPVYQPPLTQYPPQYNPQYTYAMKPDQQIYQQQQTVYYQQPYQMAYQQYPVQQVYPQQRQTSPATAFVGGLVLGTIVDDIFDPTE